MRKLPKIPLRDQGFVCLLSPPRCFMFSILSVVFRLYTLEHRPLVLFWCVKRLPFAERQHGMTDVVGVSAQRR